MALAAVLVRSITPARELEEVLLPTLVIRAATVQFAELVTGR